MKKVISSVLFVCAYTCCAQTNSWTNSVGGNWQDAHWSLGVLPGDGQAIFFTNAGSKALVIGPDTAQNFPATLRVNSITVSSVTGSINTLIISNAVSTYERLASRITFASNSAVEMNGSLLRTYDISIGGNFNQSESHLITHFLQVGDVGPGTFNLSNGVITIVPGYGSYIGGNFPAVFNQYGGTNYGRIILPPSGRYEFFDGTLTGDSGAADIVSLGGEFTQFGGSITGLVRFLKWGGSYRLMGGSLFCGDLRVPDSSTGWGAAGGNSFSQSGGTNFAGNIVLGSSGGSGDYRMDGGVMSALQVTVTAYVGLNPGSGGHGSSFSQSGGFHTNTGLYIEGLQTGLFSGVARSVYGLVGGFLSTPSIRLHTGGFTQSGGTNIVGLLTLEAVSRYQLSSGRLQAQNISTSGGWYNEITTFEQTGGINEISNDLTVNYPSKYNLSGGQLTAQNVFISNATFNHTGGVAQIPGVLKLQAGTWNEQSGGQQFGALLLIKGQSTGSNTFLLPPFPCLIRFGDSSSLVWSNDASLTIEHWSGFLHGNGQHRILFGHGAGALTAQQLAQIRFHDPAGLSPGYHPARILATGEIVPESGAPLPIIVRLANSPSNELVLGVGGEIGESYEFEVSTNLLNWNTWTNLFNADGTVWTTDSARQTLPQRFYRACQMP